MSRKTLARPATVEGIGLHLGIRCKLTFQPARARQGIVFRRTDCPGLPQIRAHVSEVSSSERRTQLGKGDHAVHTVEHVLAAVTGMEIDDITIDMDGPEPPILDGSAAPFLAALSEAGLASLEGEPEFLHLTEAVRIIDGASVYEAYPHDGLELDVTIEFPHPLIGKQSRRFTVTRDSFATELSRARTFGFVHEVDALRAKGLIKGASLDNAVVLDDSDILSGALRWSDEFVRHKAMDCIGDLALAGARVKARIVAVKPSHRGTVTLVREMVKAGRKEKGMYTIEDIMKVLPHRYPFLLVDRILEIEENKRIVGLKNVTINEPFFQGHFPGHPIMPGVLIIEAMAQVGGMLLLGSVPDPDTKVVYFMSLDNVKFRRPVKPGDQLRFELDVVQLRGTVCKMRGVGKVDGETVVEAEMAATIRDR
ncbi:MAG TPA: bifunctional UDP-3-O-[3-hydroxymyristoyl] N-acetylglucosamine deacetylase/3-hydroxyacyl-ACP dehydratase [Gemmatimonadaceae bacterium]|nr:bifunctional UDP-3-O-[3-hydroxymyristoyl] N-acetylglucosamine deacetylase/3-hydroxyacyl-ACP dehydratase [Gemmatimonadaceae bacterium]